MAEHGHGLNGKTLRSLRNRLRCPMSALYMHHYKIQAQCHGPSDPAIDCDAFRTLLNCFFVCIAVIVLCKEMPR